MRLSKDERQKIQPDFTEVQRRIYELLLRSPTTTVSFDTETDGLKPNKKQKMRPTMERTTIKYYKKDGRIFIQAVEHAYTLNKLEALIGEDLYNEYVCSVPSYYGSPSCLVVKDAKNNCGHVITVPSWSDGLDPGYFFTIIQTMKEAGAKLSKLLKEKNKPKIKEIKI